MKAVLIWRNCSLFEVEQDGFWVQCPESDIEEIIMPFISDEQKQIFIKRKEYLLSTKWAKSNPGLLVEPHSYYFMISRDGKEIQPTDPFFPYSSQWNGYCPLERMDIKQIKSIADIVSC